MAIGKMDHDGRGHHKTASKYVGQRRFAAKYSASGSAAGLLLEAKQPYRLAWNHQVQWVKAVNEEPWQ
jgi:hypothetical protein